MSENMNRDAVIARLKAALSGRSAKRWSVTGGRGTAWGWITIDAPPSRRTWSHRLKAGVTTDRPEDYEEYDTGKPGGHMGPADRVDLAQLLGLDGMHQQGYSIPSSNDYYREALERAEGMAVTTHATPYWD